MMTVSRDQLTGKTAEHLATGGSYAGVLHAEVVAPFEELKDRASQSGFDLKIISGYRSFSRQLNIWNAKVKGERPVLDDASNVINIEELTPYERVQAIMRWSALPGTSRHHWGTDFDVYDAAAVDDTYQVQLTPDETTGAGPFAKMHEWLDKELPKTDFFRPYADDLEGTGPERWHLSYAPIANSYAKELCAETIISCYLGVEIELRDSITEHIEGIFQRYIQLPNQQ